MEVGAIAMLGVARIESVTMPPSCSGLVVTHVGEHIVVDGAAFLVVTATHARDLLDRELGWKPGSWNKLVRTEKTFERHGFYRDVRGGLALATNHVVNHVKAVLVFIGFRRFSVEHLVA